MREASTERGEISRKIHHSRGKSFMNSIVKGAKIPKRETRLKNDLSFVKEYQLFKKKRMASFFWTMLSCRNGNARGKVRPGKGSRSNPNRRRRREEILALDRFCQTQLNIVVKNLSNFFSFRILSNFSFPLSKTVGVEDVEFVDLQKVLGFFLSVHWRQFLGLFRLAKGSDHVYLL